MTKYSSIVVSLTTICLVLAVLPGMAFGALSGTEATAIYNEAGTLYRNGAFATALDLYDDLIGEGIANPDLYYNASNAAFRCEQLGKAILYIERALKLAPSDPDALANLAYLTSLKKDKEPPVDNVVLAFLERRYNAVNTNAAGSWSGFSFALALVSVSVMLFTGNWIRKASIILAVIFGVTCLGASGLFFHKLHRNKTVIEAIIMKDNSSAYSGPGGENTHIFTINEGTKVIIERRQDTWNLIRLKSGAGGWIQAEMMEQI